MTSFIESITGVVEPGLTAHGFTRAPGGWVRERAGAFNAVSVFGSDTAPMALFGWQYAVLDDPDPDPRDARGCGRRMTLDVVAPTNDLQSLLSYPGTTDVAGQDRWVRRLAMAWKRNVVPWLVKWERAEGYRDFLSSRRLHLGAAWVSAALGQYERAMIELDVAHSLGRQPLTDEYDRARAERDVAIAAPFAVRHGLAAFLAESQAADKPSVVESFTRVRGSGPQAKVTAPRDEHRRLQYQQAAFAELCRRHVVS